MEHSLDGNQVADDKIFSQALWKHTVQEWSIWKQQLKNKLGIGSWRLCRNIVGFTILRMGPYISA